MKLRYEGTGEICAWIGGGWLPVAPGAEIQVSEADGARLLVTPGWSVVAEPTQKRGGRKESD